MSLATNQGHSTKLLLVLTICAPLVLSACSSSSTQANTAEPTNNTHNTSNTTNNTNNTSNSNNTNNTNNTDSTNTPKPIIDPMQQNEVNDVANQTVANDASDTTPVPNVNDQPAASDTSEPTSAAESTEQSNVTDGTQNNQSGTEPAEHNTTQTVAAPLALRAVVYTYYEIELFWANPDSSTATQWEIDRDGTRLKTVNGPSFYESGLQELTEYTYTVTPLSATGTRGPSASITLQTKADEPIITAESAKAISLEVVQQLSVQPLLAYLDQLRATYYTLFPDAPYDGAANCPNGGSATAVRTPFAFGASAGGVSLTFDHCFVGNDQWHGSVAFKQQSYPQQQGSDGEEAYCSTDFNALSFSKDGALPVEMHGNLTGRGDQYHGNEFNGRLVQRAEQGSVILDGAINVDQSNWRFATISFNYQSQQTGNRQLQVASLGQLRTSNRDDVIQEGVIEITDPAGGIVRIDVGRRGGNLQWKLTTQTSNGLDEQVFKEEENDDMLSVARWPVGADCQLVYPTDGLLINRSGEWPSSKTSDPFAPQNLSTTLDTIFAVQRSTWINEGFASFITVPAQAKLNGGTVSTIPSNEAQLLKEDISTYTDVNPDTGLEETAEYVLWKVQEQVTTCPSGGQLTKATKYAGPQVYNRMLIDQCVIENTTYDAEFDFEWVKYSSQNSMRRFDRRDDSHQLTLTNVSKSVYSALSFGRYSAENMYYKHPDHPDITVQNFTAQYNQYRDEANDDYARPVSRVSASVMLDDGERSYDISTQGSLNFLAGTKVEEQGSLVATGVDGSTLSIRTGNGDNESFDVQVNHSAGYGYTYRLPYTDDRYFKIRSE